jgi:hypothetical protein
MILYYSERFLISTFNILARLDLSIFNSSFLSLSNFLFMFVLVRVFLMDDDVQTGIDDNTKIQFIA